MDNINKKLPKRTYSHNLEELSERYFKNNLPENWIAYKPPNDYGVDLVVDIFDGESATGLELLVQLKSSEKSSKNKTEPLNLKVSTYNYLKSKVQIVIIVKYIHSEKTAFWALLRDINEPDQSQNTFSVHLSKQNILSEIDWNQIQNFISEITDEKIAAARAKEQRQRKTNKSAKKIAQERAIIFQYNKYKEHLNNSLEGVQKTEEEVKNLFLCFQNLANELRNPSSGIYLKYDHQEVIFVK